MVIENFNLTYVGSSAYETRNNTHGKNRDTGDDLYNIMPLNAKLALTQKLGGWDNSIELIMAKQKRGF